MIELPRYIVRSPGISRLRQVLDPGDDLPAVSLREPPWTASDEDDPRHTYNGGNERRYEVSKQVAGPVGIAAAGSLRVGLRPDSDVYMVTDYDLTPGAATAAARLLVMEAVTEAGQPFGSDFAITRSEYQMWQMLVAAGLAHMDQDFEGCVPDESAAGQHLFTGGDARLITSQT